MTALATNLMKGAHGEDVRTVQRALINWGYKVQADANFGRGTQTAVRTTFQLHKCLLPTGIVDQKTMDLLETGFMTTNRGSQCFAEQRNDRNLHSLMASVDPCIYHSACSAQYQSFPMAYSASRQGDFSSFITLKLGRG